VHTRPFITPLGTETPKTVRLVGTGNYVEREGQRLLLTCQHVATTQPMHYRFFANDSVFEYLGPWRMAPHPIDAAEAPLLDQAWTAVVHQAATVPVSRFASKHQPKEQAELLFFRGFAGENADYGFEIHQTNGSGYCSQEKANTGDAQSFEIFWEPSNTRYTTGTSEVLQSAGLQRIARLEYALSRSDRGRRYVDARRCGCYWPVASVGRSNADPSRLACRTSARLARIDSDRRK
jgi:hypothetical protein